MAIKLPVGKKRFYLTLTEENMIWLKDWFIRNGQKNLTAILIDEMIRGLRMTIIELEKGKADISIADLFAITGKSVEQLNEELTKR